MSEPTVTQPSPLPTNKVIAYTAGGLIGIIAMSLLTGAGLQESLQNPVVIAGIPLVFGGIAAYFVKDKPNV